MRLAPLILSCLSFSSMPNSVPSKPAETIVKTVYKTLVNKDLTLLNRRYFLLEKRCEIGLTFDEWGEYTKLTKELEGKKF